MPGCDPRVASVSAAGCPYSLPSPEEMTAAVGRMASTKAGVVEEFEP
jgi:hypothetical protein